MQKFLADRELIPAGNYVEVRYDDLEKEPINQLRKIYETLNIPGFAEAEPAFSAYLTYISGYKKNPQEIDDNVIMKVNQHWQFALDSLGYNRIEPVSSE